MHYRGSSSGSGSTGVLLIDPQIVATGKNQLCKSGIAAIFVIADEEVSLRHIVCFLFRCFQRVCDQRTLLHEKTAIRAPVWK